MKHFKVLMGFVFVTLILVTGCKKDIRTAETTASPNELSKQTNLPAKQSALSQAEIDLKLTTLMSSLSIEGKILEPSSPLQQKVHPEYREMVNRALAVTPTPCDPDTPLFLWLDEQLADWTPSVINFAVNTAMLDLPTYYAFVFENSSANQYFGVNGEYTQQSIKTFKDLKRFSDISSSDIVLAAMHGSMLLDRDKIIMTYIAVFGLSQSDAEFYADLVQDALEVVPQYRNGDHPIFTFNAFALEGFDYSPFAIVPDKIVMGDGIIDGYVAIGYGDVATQAVLAHEFAHHVQFQLGLFGGPASAEATRRTELMADAYSSYYLSHARGASMQWKRVQQFLEVFFNIGDCAFTNNGHHGTPLQRMAASEWGHALADAAQKQGHILSSEEFVALFDAELPNLVAP